MAEQFIQLPANSTGTKMRTFEQTVGANVVDHQAVVLCDSSGNIIGSLASAPTGTEQGLVTRPASLPNVTVTGGAASPNFVRTSDEPRQVFYDAFDGSVVDVTNRWTSGSAGGGVAPAQTGGNLTLGTGTTAGWSSLGSQQSFTLPIPGWMGFSSVIKLESPVTANTYRFWGAGTIPGSPTVAAPLTDAVGFELATDGKLYAVVYAAGVRTVIQDLSAATGNAKQPTDALPHRYIVYVRTDASYWYIDGIGPTNLVATSSFQGPATQALPARMLAVAGTTPASSGVITSSGTAVWDTAKNATQIADGTFPWRKATVSALGGVSVQGAAQTTVTGAITTATSVVGGTTDLSFANTATVVVSGTHAGVNITFEGSTDGGTNWYPIQGVRTDSGIAENNSGVLTANQIRAWSLALPGLNRFRVRATAWTSGSAAITIDPGTMPIEPIVAAVVQSPLNQSIDGLGSAQPFLFAAFNVNTTQTGVSLIAAPAAGRSIRVISYMITVGAQMNLSLIGGPTTLLFPLVAGGGVSFAGTLQGPAFQCNAATALTYTTSFAGQATGHFCYVVV